MTADAAPWTPHRSTGPWLLTLPPAEPCRSTGPWKPHKSTGPWLLALPLWSWLLALGVFKPSCSTPFTLFLCLVSVYRPFQLYFIPKTPSTIPPFSAPFLQLISIYPTILLYLSTTQLFFIYSSYSVVTFRPRVYAVRCIRVGGGWDPGGWGPPWGPTCFFGPDFP